MAVPDHTWLSWDLLGMVQTAIRYLRHIAFGKDMDYIMLFSRCERVLLAIVK